MSLIIENNTITAEEYYTSVIQENIESPTIPKNSTIMASTDFLLTTSMSVPDAVATDREIRFICSSKTIRVVFIKDLQIDSKDYRATFTLDNSANLNVTLWIIKQDDGNFTMQCATNLSVGSNSSPATYHNKVRYLYYKIPQESAVVFKNKIVFKSPIHIEGGIHYVSGI